MALQIWLPLNGTTKNQGLLGELTVSSPTYVDGKLGKAINTGAIKMSAEQTAQVLNNDEVSIAFWVYVNAETGSTTNREMLFGNDNNMGANNNRKFSLFQYPTCNDFHWSWMNDESLYTFAVGVLTGVLPSYKWTHVAVVYKNPTLKVFINGVLRSTSTDNVSNSSSFAYDTQVIYNSQCHYFNDYRVYNNAISEKEVHDLSKGLVVHYPLKSQYETGQVNKYSGDVAEGYLTGHFTRTKLEGERGYNYKLSYTGTGGNSWQSMDAVYFSFTVGKKYYYSCKVRCHSTNFGLFLRASRSNNDWVTSTTNVLAKADGEWHEYVVSQTINSTYDRSGSTVTCNPILEFYTDNLITSGKVYSADFDIKDVQVVESDCYVPFIDNSMSSNIISDCSGYGNDGVRNGTIIWSNNSPRYSGSYDFNGTGYIKNTSFNLNADKITISFWVKIETNTSQHFLFGTFDSWTGNGIGYYRDAGTYYYSGLLKSSAESSYGSLSTPGLTANIWYHIAIVYTGTECILYVNGVEDKRITYGSGGEILNPVCYVGNSLYNNTPSSETDESSMSDFRIYATALSDADIKELYNSPVSITSNGTLITQGEFKEE